MNRPKPDLCWERSIERFAPTEYKGNPDVRDRGDCWNSDYCGEEK